MKKRRFKKLQMSVGYSRDEAEMLARLVQISAKADAHRRQVYAGREYICFGYRYWWENVMVPENSLRRALVHYRKSRNGG